MAADPRAADTANPPGDGAKDLSSRILRAASRNFSQHGYSGTRMTRVAREAGVSRATLYKRFSTKADLLRALNEFVISQWRVWLQASVAVAPSVRVAIERWLREGLTDRDRIQSVQALTAEDAQGELLLDQAITERGLEETRQVLAMVLRRGIESGEVRGDIDVDATARALQSLLLGLQRNRATARPIAALEVEQDVDALVDLVLGGLLKPEP